MSIFRVEVVPITLEPHPHADTLSIVRVFDYSVCVRTSDWQNKSIGAYIPPDSVVPDNDDFAFLQGKTRIKVRRLRGIVSMGLLVPAPLGAQVGQDVASLLGITHYEPSLNDSGEIENPPGISAPEYDVEHMLRFASLFQENEPVHVTEKIHGVNSRFIWHEGRMWCGSKKEWKKQDNQNLWWCALAQNPWIEFYCHSHPGDILYAEVFGDVQSIKYGSKKGHYQIRVFDILRNGNFLSYELLSTIQGLELVPSLGIHPFNLEKLKIMAEGSSLIKGSNHIREGIVVRPLNERWTNEIGRLQLKLISNNYLEHE